MDVSGRIKRFVLTLSTAHPDTYQCLASMKHLYSIHRMENQVCKTIVIKAFLRDWRLRLNLRASFKHCGRAKISDSLTGIKRCGTLDVAFFSIPP
jgi:hypothetical protein